MKFRKNLIEKASSAPSDLRRVLHEPYLDVDHGVLVASCGAFMAVSYVEIEHGDKNGSVSRKALVQARKDTPKGDAMAALECGFTHLTSSSGTAFARPDLGPFPDWARVSGNALKAIPEKPDLALDAKLLFELMKALQPFDADAATKNGIRIYLPRNAKGDIDSQGGIVVKPIHHPKDADDRDYGLLMPMRY